MLVLSYIDITIIMTVEYKIIVIMRIHVPCGWKLYKYSV